MSAHRWTAEVVVVGAGAIGAATALELAKRGHEVLVLERGSGWAAECSWGNAGLVCPSHAGPFATRADLGNAARWMTRPDSPLGIAPEPALAGFLTRLLASTRPSVHRRVLAASRAMCLEALDGHRRLAEAHGTGLQQVGLLDTYETPERLRAASAAAAEHRSRGLRPEVLDATAVRELEPALGEQTVGGVLYPDEAHCDPVSFVEAVGRAALARGVRLESGTDVLSLTTGATGCTLETTSGTVRAGRVVVAAGTASGRLVAPLGTSVCLRGGKGYAVDLAADGRRVPVRPFMLQESRVAVTPLGDRLRLAGTMQFTAADTSIDRRRVAGIRGPAARLLPGWADATVVSVWSGLRPCTPDGLPLLGWVDEHERVALSSGHAMLGLTLAPLAAEQAADLVEGKPVAHAEHLRVDRFSLRRGGRAAGAA